VYRLMRRRAILRGTKWFRRKDLDARSFLPEYQQRRSGERMKA